MNITARSGSAAERASACAQRNRADVIWRAAVEPLIAAPAAQITTLAPTADQPEVES